MEENMRKNLNNLLLMPFAICIFYLIAVPLCYLFMAKALSIIDSLIQSPYYKQILLTGYEKILPIITAIFHSFHYSKVLLFVTVIFVLTSLIKDNILTRLVWPYITKVRNIYWGLLYAAVLAIFVIVAIRVESYRDNWFLYFSIGISLYCAFVAAIYGGKINNKTINGIAFLIAFLFSILVWIAESYSSYYSGVEIGASQGAVLYQNTVKSIILSNSNEEIQKKKILELSKNTSGVSIEAKILKNGVVFLEPISRKRPGYTLSERSKIMDFKDDFGNSYQVSYQFYNRPYLTTKFGSKDWGGLTKAIIFSVNEAYEVVKDYNGNVKKDKKGNIITKDNLYFFSNETYLRSLNLWWFFWLMYSLIIYGFYHYHEKVDALGARDKALAAVNSANVKLTAANVEKDEANRKLTVANIEKDAANQKLTVAIKEKDAANQKLTVAIKEKDEAYQKQKEAFEELEDYKVFFDDMQKQIDDKISESRNTLQIVDSSWSKIAQEANKAVLDGYRSKRHDTFNYFNDKLKTWGKEDFLAEINKPGYKEKLENYMGNIEVIDQTYYKEKGNGQSFLSETYGVVLGPWLLRIRNDLQNLDDIFDLTPSNITVDKIIKGITSEKTIKKVKCNVRISNDINREAECCIIPDKLQSMVYNLLENSSQAGDRYYEVLRQKDKKLARGYKTDINLYLQEIELDNKKYLSIEVQDNCGGFPHEIENIIYVDKVKSSKATNIDHGNGTYLIGRFAKRMGIIVQHKNIILEGGHKGAQTTLLVPYV